MEIKSSVVLYIDDDPQPVGEFPCPVSFELDTRRLTDGEHVLKIIGKDYLGKEGIRLIPFNVRNGPAIAVEGIRKDETVEGVLPLMINAYSKGNQKVFLLHGSETPQSIPWWIVAGIILFAAWTVYFVITSFSVNL
ncbi:cytochrome C [Mucilaginibacter pallidiroseus]|uniref:Cytochrome C n=1 Tax=Mucilaginibacter pallidiroseus TaxID=2599295 RepID=A0A563U062_9SPHI|nr:cytochrome C [Mucilaginibacter pallidiroseus]TWR24392.1 cytochrome C [Mucilaginibacter pallidiroseus]